MFKIHLLICCYCGKWCVKEADKKARVAKASEKKEIDSELNIMISRFNGHFTVSFQYEQT